MGLKFKYCGYKYLPLSVILPKSSIVSSSQYWNLQLRGWGNRSSPKVISKNQLRCQSHVQWHSFPNRSPKQHLVAPGLITMLKVESAFCNGLKVCTLLQFMCWNPNSNVMIFFYCCSVTVVPIFPCCSPLPPAPSPTVNPHPVVYNSGSFIPAHWLDLSPSFPP